jgi:hypothetical protein
MEDERDQYYMLTKNFVESFQFNNKHYQPSVTFRIFDNPIYYIIKTTNKQWPRLIDSQGTVQIEKQI